MERDEVILALDEKPNIQVLERCQPTRLMRPDKIERREFEYIRHRTVNFLVALIVHSGKIRGWCLPANDSYELCRVLPRFFYNYRKARRIHVIWDGGSSHISEYTQEFLRLYQPQVRVFVNSSSCLLVKSSGTSTPQFCLPLP